MIASFRNLMTSLNHTSGRPSWWVLYAVGMLMVAAWIVAMLPWVDVFTGSNLGVGRYGTGFSPTLIAYGVEIPARAADYYFIAALLGIAPMKLGILFTQVGGSFARGYKFVVLRPELGILGEHWTR